MENKANITFKTLVMVKMLYSLPLYIFMVYFPESYTSECTVNWLLLIEFNVFIIPSQFLPKSVSLERDYGQLFIHSLTLRTDHIISAGGVCSQADFWSKYFCGHLPECEHYFMDSYLKLINVPGKLPRPQWQLSFDSVPLLLCLRNPVHIDWYLMPPFKHSKWR